MSFNNRTSDNKAINEILKMMPYVAPIREVLNIDSNDLFYMRFCIILNIFVTFLSLCLLFALNNFHILVYFLEKFNSSSRNDGVLRTKSVLDFINKKFEEKNQLDCLEELLQEDKKDKLINNLTDDLIYIPVSKSSLNNLTVQSKMPFKTSKNKMYGDLLKLSETMTIDKKEKYS